MHRLQHPSVARLLGVTMPDQGGIALVTEFMEGGSLDRVSRGRISSFPWAQRALYQQVLWGRRLANDAMYCILTGVVSAVRKRRP